MAKHKIVATEHGYRIETRYDHSSRVDTVSFSIGAKPNQRKRIYVTKADAKNAAKKWIKDYQEAEKKIHKTIHG